MLRLVIVKFFCLFFISCATTKPIIQETRKGLEPLPKGYKTIYPNSNNFTFYDSEKDFQVYTSQNYYKNTITGMFFLFLNGKNEEKLLLFDLKYCNIDRIYFNKVILYGENQTLNIHVDELDSKKYDNGLICDIYGIEPDINDNLNKIYNLYKTNQNIKIKFIGRDGKSYIVPVSEQHRKDLIELVDYYRMLTHKSE